MKISTSLLALALLAFAAPAVNAQDGPPLAFPLSVGGQAATLKAGEAFARIAKPVAANAPIEVGAGGPMTIINVVPYDLAKKAPVQGAPTAIILLQGTQKSALDQTMDKAKLTAGNYLMSVTADNKTDSVLLQVQ